MQLVDAVYVIMAWATATNLANVSCWVSHASSLLQQLTLQWVQQPVLPDMSIPQLCMLRCRMYACQL
jgi:hypothetical protein